MRKKRWVEREAITAVHDNDLVEFLDSIGILEKIETGECRCAKCAATVSLDNLGAVFPKGSNIYVLCERPPCMSEIDHTLIDNE